MHRRARGDATATVQNPSTSRATHHKNTMAVGCERTSAHPIEVCPYRLRVNFSNKRCRMTRHDARRIQAMLPESQCVTEVGGMVYLGFRDYPSIQRAFDACGTSEMICTVSRRMLDPYAIHVALTRHHSLREVSQYFAKYGAISCVVDHVAVKGRYAFVNFMQRGASMCALEDGASHIIQGVRCKVRGKVLSAAEPFFPKPYSPARYTA